MELSTGVGSGSLQGLYERYWENYERSLEGDPWPAQGQNLAKGSHFWDPWPGPKGSHFWSLFGKGFTLLATFPFRSEMCKTPTGSSSYVSWA